MSEKVIVAVDGGTASAAALDWVIERARTADVTLEITTVADLDWVPDGEVERFMPEYDRVVLDASRHVDASGVAVRYSTTVHRGRALEGLLSASRRADLLVIGTHKTPAAVGIINGTLPLSIAARTSCPLVVVPVGWLPKPGPIVAGVDADTGESALLFAAREAERGGRNLVAVRAWDLPPAVAGALMTFKTPYDELERDNRTMLTSTMAPVRAVHGSLKVKPILEYGRPSMVLTAAAANASLTVVGTHHRGALAGFFLGSVGHDLLMNMPSPVAIVPDPVDRSFGVLPADMALVP